MVVVARAADADVLVSGDRDLQVLRGQLQCTLILTATEFADWLAQRATPSASEIL